MKSNSKIFAVIAKYLRLQSYRLRKDPLFYLLGYLIVIFGFSLIYYYALPGRNLYHSTSQYEYEFFTNAADEILTDLKLEIIKGIAENSNLQKDLNDWQMDVNTLDTKQLNVANYPSKLEIGFDVNVPITHTTQGQVDSVSFLSANVTLNLNPIFPRDNQVYLYIVLKDTSPPLPNGIPKLQILFPTANIVSNEQSYAGVLPLSVDLYKKMVGFGEGYRGFPSKVNGSNLVIWKYTLDAQYIRMLYLSTGVATSSAFGDIVPVSTLARILVTHLTQF